MPLVVFYFQLHQPFRLHPDADRFLWDDLNGDVFKKVSEKSYLPALEMFKNLISDHGDFKITLGISGTFLEQAQMYEPRVIKLLEGLLRAGEDSQVEILGETYYHSLCGLFSDPSLREFRDQVRLHGDTLRKLFGVVPTSFRNTELMYNNRIAKAAAEMGYRSILCEKRADMYASREKPISPNAVFRAKGCDLLVIPRNRELSDDIAYRFTGNPVSPEDYARALAEIDGEAVLLGYDFEHIGEHIWRERGIFEFWQGLPAALHEHASIVQAVPAEVADHFQDTDCPVVDIHALSTSSWADETRDTKGWLGNFTQYSLFKEIEGLEERARIAGGDILLKWRHLTTSDQVYFLHEGFGEDHAVHSYFNPYGGSIAQAYHVLTRKIDHLGFAVERFLVRKRPVRTAVLIITPETGRLPEDMGGLAKFISGKSGGQGEVVSALCEGLSGRGVDVHLATLNLKKRFQRESGMDEKEWREMRYRIDPANIHLVGSSVFAENLSAYEGDPLRTAAEFQKEIVNNLLKDIRAHHQGKLIIHSHDWMAGGIVTAYAKARGLPVLHTVHNVFTAYLPLDYLAGVNIANITDNLFYFNANGRLYIDCQATAIKNATLINFVGEQFLVEVVNDYFLDRLLVPPGVRKEVKAKYENDEAHAIINAPSPNMYPERSPHLVLRYGPDDDVLAAKRENLLEFQRRTGLKQNPDAILFFWPSRLDPFQKGVELLEEVAIPFVNAHREVQLAIVADGIGLERTHLEILGAMAFTSGGRIACYPFREDLSMLGYAAANDVFGASLYEPCGQIDQVGNIFGATATNRDTGGYHDKIKELTLKQDGAPEDAGNGFLFRDYDAGGLRHGLEKSLAFHRKPRDIREREIKRIMSEARERYQLGNMITGYMRLYERLNGGEPLF
ncbi:MAG: glycogen/starch synthase [Smithellaceae bacterium]|nr:glycogen/starch synthase [Smithellaceae bacterium]